MLILSILIVMIVTSMVVYAISRRYGFIAMQLSLALTLVYATYAIALWVLRRDKLMVDRGIKTVEPSKTLIISGFSDASYLQRTIVDTLNPEAMSFANMPRSVNRRGGAQFTYQFWILLTNTLPSNVAFKDILIRGDLTRYNIVTVDPNDKDRIVDGPKEDVLIKCPRIRFNETFDELAVEVNTIDDPNPPPIKIKGTLRLVPNKWVLCTFAFQDDVAMNDFEDGVQMRFYINDLLVQKSTMKSALRQNNGNLYLFPSGAVEGCKIGDLSYYNYAVTQGEVADVYNRGVPKAMAVTRRTPLPSPLYLTEYNKLDILMR
jgi:hypothetical protein